MTAEALWVAVGFLGQGLFAARFVVQWVHSEMRGESVVPVVFWYFSLAGGTVLLSYAIWRGDPVFITGQSLGLLIYARNLALIRGTRRRGGGGGAAA